MIDFWGIPCEICDSRLGGNNDLISTARAKTKAAEKGYRFARICFRCVKKGHTFAELPFYKQAAEFNKAGG